MGTELSGRLVEDMLTVDAPALDILVDKLTTDTGHIDCLEDSMLAVHMVKLSAAA